MEPPGGEDQEGFRHPETLENRTPVSVMTVYSNVIQFLQQYGWFLLLAVVLLFVVKQKLQKFLAKRPRQSSEQDLHRYDSETALRRQEGFDASRRRLQEKHNADAAVFAEEQKKKDEEKKKQKIAEWEKHLEGKGYWSKYRPSESPTSSASSSASTSAAQKKKPAYKTTDYNPLSGGGNSGTGYRPAARRGGGG